MHDTQQHKRVLTLHPADIAHRRHLWELPSSMASAVIYARGRHQWMSNGVYEIGVIYVSSVGDTTQH